ELAERQQREQLRAEEEAERRAEMERQRLADQQRAQQEAARRLEEERAAQEAAPPPSTPPQRPATATTQQRPATATTQPAASQPAPQPAEQPAAPPPAPRVSNTLRPVSLPPPEYPRVAQRRGIAGSVEVEFTVGTDGTVTSSRVVSASPPRTFDRAALSAVDRWRFEPVGSPITTRRTIEFKPAN